MKKINDIYLFGNGNIAVFDGEGKQISKLQSNPILRVIEEAKRLGYDVSNTMISTPFGKTKYNEKYNNY